MNSRLCFYIEKKKRNGRHFIKCLQRNSLLNWFDCDYLQATKTCLMKHGCYCFPVLPFRDFIYCCLAQMFSFYHWDTQTLKLCFLFLDLGIPRLLSRPTLWLRNHIHLPLLGIQIPTRCLFKVVKEENWEYVFMDHAFITGDSAIISSVTSRTFMM